MSYILENYGVLAFFVSYTALAFFFANKGKIQAFALANIPFIFVALLVFLFGEFFLREILPVLIILISYVHFLVGIDYFRNSPKYGKTKTKDIKTGLIVIGLSLLILSIVFITESLADWLYG